ncbi:MAG: hypothetical protein WDA25_00975 [Paracoccaceae bacterium]
MMVYSLLQTSFNGGELSARLEGRPDLAAYGIAAREILNMIVTVQGPAVKRSGTRFVAMGGGAAELIPFEYNVTQGYVIEALDGAFRFYTNDVRIETSPGVPYEISTPYGAADLAAIDWAQSLDVLYLVDGRHPPQKLRRTSATSFAIAPLELSNGPFADQNLDEGHTVRASAGTGTVTLTANKALFEAGHVGSLIELEAVDFRSIPAWEPNVGVTITDKRRSEGKVYRAVGMPASGSGRTGSDRPIHTEGQARDGTSAGKDYNDEDVGGVLWEYEYSIAGIARITGVTDSMTATAEIVQRLPDEVVNTPTHLWAMGAFSTAAGWPQAIVLRDERMWLAKGNELFASVAGDLENFSSRDDSGLPQPDLAIRRRLSAPEPVRWMVDDLQLLIGTARREYAATPVNPAQAIAYNNLATPKQSGHGSAPVKPVVAGSSTIFVQRGERKLRAADYTYDRNKYLAPDVTVRAEHITMSGIRRLAAQVEPEGSIWALRRDGVLVDLTWNDAESVRGFSRIALGGPGAAVESIAVIPAPDGTHDQLWMTVRRTIGGMTRRTIERMETLWTEGQDPDDGYFVDCGLSYAGQPATSISGLDHLIGETVTVIADGATHPDRVVAADGSIVLDRPAARVHVGYLYLARVKTMRLVADIRSGSSLSKLKRVVKLGLGLQETLGIRVRRPGGRNEEIPFRKSGMAMDAPPELFTGEKLVGFPGTWDREARVVVESFQALPFTLNSIGPRLDVTEGE